MKRTLLATALAVAFIPAFTQAAGPIGAITHLWTYDHANTGVAGQTSEIAAFDSLNNQLWVVGIQGVDVLNASTGSLVQHIDTSTYGNVNSVAIHNGVAALAIENTTRTTPGEVKFFDTTSRTLTGGINSITVGALPDMLTFTPDGTKLLVANEGSPSTYGARLADSDGHRNYGAAAADPVGSVSIIDMNTRSVIATPTFNTVTPVASNMGSNIRTNTGMDFEPEYITVSADGSKAFVSLQEANAMGVIDLTTNATTQVIGLGVKDFNAPGDTLDTNDNGTVSFGNVAAKGLFMPDGMATYDAAGNTFIVMANEGDFREDDADRSRASSFGRTGDLGRLRVSNTDSSATGEIFAAGARSFSIRDVNGNLVYDSGDILDKAAFAEGLYDDDRSDDKGMEPEGVALLELDGHTLAFIGLERTTSSAVAIFDITNPYSVSYLDMIVTPGTFAPEGLTAYSHDGKYYLAIANEADIEEGIIGKTALYELAAPVPEADTYAFMLLGMSLVGLLARRRKSV